MPLDYLGQLKPSMKQQIALQRALLALQREDDEIRAKTMPQPTQGGGTVKPYAGPTPTLGGAETTKSKTAATTRAPLAQALTPSIGAPDIQGEAWAKRTEMVEANQAKLDAEADALYGSIQGLSREDQNYLLSKITGKRKGGALTSALKGGSTVSSALSPEERDLYYAELNEQNPDYAGEYGPQSVAIKGRTDPLLQTMIDKNYIRQDETGYSWMLPEEKQEVLNVSTWTDEQGWLNQTTVFKDGTTDTQILGRGEKEAAGGVTLEQEIALGEYGMKTQEFSERHRNAAIKDMGDMPRPGIDTLTIDGKDVIATAEHAQAWIEGVNVLTAYRAAQAGEAPVEGEVTMSDVKAQYEGRPDLISNIQQNLGIPVTGVWDDETNRQFELYGDVDMRGTEGEPKESSAEKRKRAWDTWFKKWGKTFKGISKAVRGAL